MEQEQQCPLLGQILLASGAIQAGELREALAWQETSGRPLGEILIELGALAPRQLERGLETQGRLRGYADPERPFVLLVDDDVEVGALVRDVLVGAGYRVGVAQNEGEAVAAVLSSDSVTPDLMVLDLGLPEHGGIELLTILRKNASTHDMRVVVLTGHAELEQDVRRRGLDITEFLVKPVTVRDLVAVVDSVLRPDRNQYAAGDLAGGVAAP